MMLSWYEISWKHTVSKVFFFFLLLISVGAFSSDFSFDVSIPAERETIVEYSTGPSKNYIDKEIRLLVWNIYKGKKNDWKNEYRTLAKDKDLILLQEFVDSKKLLKTGITRGDGLSVFFARAYKYPIITRHTGVVTVSNTSPRETAFYRPKGYEPKILRTKKISLATYYQVRDSSKTLLVLNTHALNWAKFGDFVEQIKELEIVVDQHQGPVIWAGDFNLWAGEKEKYFFEMLNRHQLSEVVFKEDLRTRYEDGLAVDYILVRGLELLDSRVKNRPDASDHNPLEATLLIQ